MKIEFMEFRHKPTMVKAAQMQCDFSIPTIEGQMDGHAGDYLVIGTIGEAWPVKREIFEDTYEIPQDEQEDAELRPTVTESFQKMRKPNRIKSKGLKILKLLENAQQRSSIESVTGYSAQVVAYHLRVLKDKGLAKMSLEGAKTFWKITELGRDVLAGKENVKLSERKYNGTLVQPERDNQYMEKVRAEIDVEE